MRILLVSDLHYKLRQFDWLMQSSDGCDVVVIAGDVLDVRSYVPLDAQAIAITAQLRALGSFRTVVVASGNHDLDGRDDAGEKAATWLGEARTSSVHIDGDSVFIGDTLFTVCPWWDGPQGRAELDERLHDDARMDKARWVWIYHAPPKGSPLAWDGQRDFGDDALVDWLATYEPDVVLTGHIHQAPFVDGGGWAQQVGRTWLFNAGQQPGPVPAHVVIDLAAGTAEWLSATDRDEVALATRD